MGDGDGVGGTRAENTRGGNVKTDRGDCGGGEAVGEHDAQDRDQHFVEGHLEIA